MAILVSLVILAGLIAFIVGTSSLDKHRQSGAAPRLPKPAQSPRHQHQRFEAEPATPVPSTPLSVGKAYVIDGGSLGICRRQVRLFGGDAPELNYPFGQKAKWAMVALCKGQVIRAEVTDTDAHGRTMARCYPPDGRDLSAEILRQGLAIDWVKFSGGKYRAMEVPDARKKLWLADARQNGRMHVGRKFEARQKLQAANR